MNRKVFIALALTIQMILVVAMATSLLAAGGGGISGSVFHDVNNSGSVDTNEPNVGNATVYVQRLGTDVPVAIASDADGWFVVADLPIGTYHVWAEDPTHDMIPGEVVEVEIGEVSGLGEPVGNVTVDLPIMYDLADGIRFFSVSSVFLPFVSR